MKKCILGKKLGMTQLIKEDGNLEPVTVVQAGPCFVLEKKTVEKHGYGSVVLGYQELKEKKACRAKLGYFKKANTTPKRFVKEFRLDNLDEVGQELTIEQFKENDLVDVASKSIGKGFAGTIKRHNFARGPMSHGSKSHRLPGSIGAGTDPSHVFKGKRMGGHLGDKRVTVKNLEILKLDLENNLIFIKGAIPGKKNNLVEIVGRG